MRVLRVTDTNIPNQTIASTYALPAWDDPATPIANDAFYTMEVQRDVGGNLIDYEFSIPSIFYGPYVWYWYGPFAAAFTAPANGDLIVDYLQDQAVSVIVTIQSLTPGADITAVSVLARATDGSGYQSGFGTPFNRQGSGSDPVGLGRFTSSIDSMGREIVKAEFLAEPGHPYRITAQVHYAGVSPVVPVPTIIELPASDFEPCATAEATMQVEKPPTGAIKLTGHLVADPADVQNGVGPRAKRYQMALGGTELDGTPVPGPTFSWAGSSDGLSPANFGLSGLPLGSYQLITYAGYTDVLLEWPDRALTTHQHGLRGPILNWPVPGQVYSPFDAGDNQTFGMDRGGEIILTTDDPVDSAGEFFEEISIQGDMAYLNSGIDFAGCATSAIIESGTATILGASEQGDIFINELGRQRTALGKNSYAISRGLFKNDGSGDYEVVLLDGEWIEDFYGLHLVDDQGADETLYVDFNDTRAYSMVSGRANQLNPDRRALELGKVTVRVTVQNLDGSLRPFSRARLVIPSPAGPFYQPFDDGNGIAGRYRADARSGDAQAKEQFVAIYGPVGSKADISVSATVPQNDDGTGPENVSIFGDLLDVPFVADAEGCSRVCLDSVTGRAFIDDGDSPSITVNGVPPSTSADHVDLAGMATDAVPIVALTVNGVSQTVTDPGVSGPFSQAFSQNVALAIGINTFEITATDLCGNTTTFEVVIVRTDNGLCDNPTDGGSGCCGDGFDEIGPEWMLTDLGDAVGGLAAVVGGELHLSGTGSEMYHGADHGAFLHQPLTGDFRVEVDVTGVPVDAGGIYRKGGLIVRDDDSPNAPRVMIQYIPHYPTPDRPALQFDYRGIDGVAKALASTVPNVTLPVRLAIQRRDDVFSVYFSTDGGGSWVQPLGGSQGQIEIGMSDSVDAGLTVTSYDQIAATFAFEDFAVCSPRGEAPVPTTLPCTEGPRDVVYLLDLSDSMRRTHGDPLDQVSKFESAREALLAVNAGLGLLDDGTRGALVTFRGAGVNVESGFTEDFALLATLLNGFQLPVLNPYDPRIPTPSAISLEGVEALLAAERDPSHPVVVIQLTDGIPNLDGEARGPLVYREAEVAAIELRDGMGGFFSSGHVSWLGGYNPSIGTFDGEPIADAMVAIERLRDVHGDLRALSLVARGSLVGPINPPVLPEDLLDYAAYYTQGATFGSATPAGLVAQAPVLLDELACGGPGKGGVTGVLWRDGNGDGLRDAGEAFLPGITVSLDGAQSAITDSRGRYSFSGLAAGSYTVAVSVAADEVPTFDADGIQTPHMAIVAVAPWQFTSAEFGYEAEGVGGPITGCRVDDFDTLEAAWTLSELGDADQGSVAVSGGELYLTGDGSSLYTGSDHGVFLHQQVPGSFRMEVDVTGFPVDAGGSFQKAGLMVRAGLDPDDPRLIIQAVPDFGGTGRSVVQFRYRAVTSGPGDLALGSNAYDVSLPVRLAVERSGSEWSVAFSSDGAATWVQPAGGSQGSVSLDLGESPFVGPNVVSYSVLTALTASFDDLSLCEGESESRR